MTEPTELPDHERSHLDELLAGYAAPLIYPRIIRKLRLANAVRRADWTVLRWLACTNRWLRCLECIR